MVSWAIIISYSEGKEKKRELFLIYIPTLHGPLYQDTKKCNIVGSECLLLDEK